MLVNHVLAVQHSEQNISNLCHAWFQVCKMLCSGVGLHGRPQTLVCNDAMIAAMLMVYNITRTF